MCAKIKYMTPENGRKIRIRLVRTGPTQSCPDLRGIILNLISEL